MKETNFAGQGRILILAGCYLPVVGGYIKIVHELARKFVDLGYTVDILTCNCTNEVQHEVLDDINIHRLSSWNLVHGSYPVPTFSLGNISSVLNLAKNDYQCIITNTRFYPICFVGWILSKFYRTPLIHLEHGSCHTVSDSFIVSTFGRIYDHTLGSILVKSAKMNFGVSIPAVMFLNHLGAKNAKVMHNGIDLSAFENTKPIGYTKAPGRTVITYIGRLVYGKGVQDLLSIFPKLKGDVQLLIVGDGPYRGELEALARQVNTPNIVFSGEQRPEYIPGILKSTDIFVNPSYSEGLPTSVLEACAAGCAVVATDVGGTGEIILDGLTGLLVKPGDQQGLTEKVNLLLENKSMRDALGKNAKAYAMDNFS
ncbi:glycosyltransferase family 4 protein, partial [Methanoculleus bourgensis]|uniref:glycosyltransferase family 4 protein n=1 Tax=Methanoculleus bourgensis TaxID=83986 RepID=UPI003B95FD4D